MTGVTLLLAPGPGIIPHLRVHGGTVAMAIGVQAGLAGCDILWLRHSDDGPLTVHLDVDGAVQVSGLFIASGIDAIGVTEVTGVLPDPLGTGQPGVAVGLHADDILPEIGQGVGARPIMAGAAVGVGRQVGIVFVVSGSKCPSTIMAFVAFAVGNRVGVFPGIDHIGQVQPSIMTGVAGQRIAWVEILPVLTVFTTVVGRATTTILMASVAPGESERIHDPAT